MKRLLTIILLLLAILPMNAEDTIRSLVITEWRGDFQHQAYVELTNMGDSALDLSRFALSSVPIGWAWPNSNMDHRGRLQGILPPGKSFLIMNYYDQRGVGRDVPLEMVPLADMLIFPAGAFNVDSVSPRPNMLRLWEGTYATALWYRLSTGDSVLIDAVNNAVDETGKTTNIPSNVAGIQSATYTHTLVRKTNVTLGNTNWDNARGVDLADSEWLPIPHGNRVIPIGPVFTTIKNHGNYNIDLQSAIIGINISDTTLTVPWGILNGDSIIREFTLGPNMGWMYHKNSNPVDSAYTTVRNGDRLVFYAAGLTLQQMDFEIMVSEPATNMAKVFPIRNKNYETGWWTNVSRYYITDGHPIIDTIGNVPYATRTDTLFAYLEKAPLASWEIVWVDGTERVDLKYGDKLKVTAQDGVTVKEYFIDVLDYEANSNSNLGAITWPDIPFFIEGWKADTIPFFSPTRYSYYLTLPYGTTEIPALKAYSQNLNAVVETKRAISFKGSIEDRTTTFTVTAEDDTTVSVYSILFDIEKTEIQPNRAEPFFSQYIHAHFFASTFLEIVNPGNVPLSLDEYMIVQSDIAGTPAQALSRYLNSTEDHWNYRNLRYVPGYRPQSLADWMAKPGMLTLDPSVDPVLDPGEVFIVGKLNSRDDRLRPILNYLELVDMHFSPNQAAAQAIYNPPYQINKWGETGFVAKQSLCFPGGIQTTYYLFKIENDSVLTGKKPVGDPNDYRLIDVFGKGDNTAWVFDSVAIKGSDYPSFWRKPNVWKGNPEPGGAFGTNMEDSEWIPKKFVNGSATPWPQFIDGLGGHALDPTFFHLSTVLSNTYLVSDGYSELQSIQGNMAGTTLSEFYKKIIKADTGQVLTMKSGVNGSVKNPDDLVAGSDTLVVLSADGKNTTRYLIINQPLDNNAILTAKDGSGYVIEISEGSGTISGMSFGENLSEVLGNLVKPILASLYVIDDEGHLVPTKVLNYDTLYVDVKVGDSYFVEVVAQDGITKITYKLAPASLSSEAYVISSIYEVNQDQRIISKIPYGTNVHSFIDNVEASGKATVKILDKAGLERTFGTIAYDDRLVVTSEDLSNMVVYYLDFLDEMNPDRSANAKLSDLIVDGNSIDGFNADTYSYTVVLNVGPVLPPVPVVTATTIDAQAVLTITQAESLEGSEGQRTATVKVLAQDGVTEITYTVLFNVVVGVPGHSGNDINIYAEGKTICIKTDAIGQNDEVEVYNVMGQKIMHRKMISTFERLDVNYPGNLFIVKVKWAGKMEIEKLILK